MKTRLQHSDRRTLRIRAKIKATTQRPRLTVSRSNKELYAQIIDQSTGKVLACYNTLMLKDATKISKQVQAGLVGENLAKVALANKVKTVTFDRGSYLYHGRVKACADGARKGGLEF